MRVTRPESYWRTDTMRGGGSYCDQAIEAPTVALGGVLVTSLGSETGLGASLILSFKGGNSRVISLGLHSFPV